LLCLVTGWLRPDLDDAVLFVPGRGMVPPSRSWLNPADTADTRRVATITTARTLKILDLKTSLIALPMAAVLVFESRSTISVTRVG